MPRGKISQGMERFVGNGDIPVVVQNLEKIMNAWLLKRKEDFEIPRTLDGACDLYSSFQKYERACAALGAIGHPPRFNENLDGRQCDVVFFMWEHVTNFILDIANVKGIKFLHSSLFRNRRTVYNLKVDGKIILIRMFSGEDMGERKDLVIFDCMVVSSVEDGYMEIARSVSADIAINGSTVTYSAKFLKEKK
jgi:hypothetical protein